MFKGNISSYSTFSFSSILQFFRNIKEENEYSVIDLFDKHSYITTVRLAQC